LAVNCSALLGSTARAPDGGIPGGVETTDDHDLCGFRQVKERVGKALHEMAADAALDHGADFRVSDHRIERGVERCEEIPVESNSSLAIPSKRRLEVRLGGRREARVHSCSSSARTSAQGRASSGLASWSARRRRSSARWASLTESVEGFSTKLDQMSSMRRIRSSGGSCWISESDGMAIPTD